MRRYFKYQDPSGEYTISDEEILETYYDHWKGELTRLGRESMISPEACIEDFVAVHWAWEIPVEENT